MSYCEVIHGKEKKKLSKQITMEIEVIRGYYFIYKNKDGDKIAVYMVKDENKSASLLESFAEKYCTEKFNYWWQIDYCFGPDVTGKLQWADFYCGESLLAILESVD